MEYEHCAIKAPLHLTAEQKRVLWDWTDFLLDVEDAAVLQRHQFRHIKNFRVDKSVPKNQLKDRNKRWYLTYYDQQEEVKHLRAMYNENGGNIPSTVIASVLQNKDDAFKRFVKAIADQKNVEKDERKSIDEPKPKADVKRMHPHWRRSLNFRTHLDTMQRNIRRKSGNPAYVEFSIPNLGTAKYKTGRDIPENAKLTEATISVEDEKWWVSFAYKFPEPEKPDLQVTRPEDVPDFAGLTSKQIVDLVDTGDLRPAGGDQGITNNWTMSDKTYRRKFNLNSAAQSRKYALRLKMKHYQRMLSHKRSIHGDDAPNSKTYQKILKKKRLIQAKIANIDDNRRHQTAAHIDKTYDVFVAEDLNSANMLEKMPGRNTSRRMAETGFGGMIDILRRKLDSRLILVDPAYTSQKCAACGHVHKNNRYGEKFRCKGCGHACHADYNASINIMAAGIVAEPEKFRFKVMSESGSA